MELFIEYFGKLAIKPTTRFSQGLKQGLSQIC